MSRRTVILRDLEPAELYAVQLRAKSWNNESPWSPKFEFVTIEDTVAPESPSTPVVIVDGSDFILTYTAPTLNEDGSITEDFKDYLIDVYPVGSPGQATRFVITDTRFSLGFDTNRNIFGGPENEVAFDVYSRDLAGNISTSPSQADNINLEPETFTTLDAIPERRAIKLEWDRPTGANPGSNNPFDISHYEIFRNGTSLAEVGNGTYAFMDADPGRGTHSYEVIVHDLYENTLTSNTVQETALGYWEDDLSIPKAPVVTDVSTDIEDRFAYIDITFDAPIENEDNSDYTDHLEFEIRWGRSGEPYRYATISDDRTVGTDIQSFTYRIESVNPGDTYSVDVRATDRYQNHSNWAEDSIVAAVDDSVPNKPSPPTLAGNMHSIQVMHDLNDDSANPLPISVEILEIHASYTSTFTPDSSTLIAQASVNDLIRMGQTLLHTVDFESETDVDQLYVRVIAVTGYPQFSPYSDAVGEIVELVDTLNVKDAAITTAKIQDLDADKITAGQGFINDLLVKSQLTIDENGDIRSSNYSPDTSGYILRDDGLEINDGSIAASLLSISVGANLIPVSYSIFTQPEEWYNTELTLGDHTFEITANDAWFGETSIRITRPSTGDIAIHPNSYPIRISESGDYTLSFYVMGDGVDVNLNASLYEEVAGLHGSTGTKVATNGAWTRIEHTFTGVSIGKYHIRIQIEDEGSTVNLDAMQLEPGTEASSFRVSGLTTIDGGMITTGALRSNDWVATSGQDGWRIDFNGDADFNDGRFRGQIEATSGWVRNILEVGTSSGTGEIRSLNFNGDLTTEDPGDNGWGIHSNGYAIFNDGEFRGTVVVGNNSEFETGYSPSEVEQAAEDAVKSGLGSDDYTSIDGGQLITGTITANAIGAKQINTYHMRVGGGDNLWPDPTFSHSVIGDFSATGSAGTWSLDTRGVGDSWVHSGDTALRIDFSGTDGQGWFRGPGDDPTNPDQGIPISPGEKLYLSFHHGANSDASSADIQPYIVFFDASGSVIGSAHTDTAFNMRGSGGMGNFYESKFTAPANTQFVSGGVKVYDRGGMGVGFVDSITMRRAVSPALIVDGIIKASVRIDAGQVQVGDSLTDDSMSGGYRGITLDGSNLDDIFMYSESSGRRYLRMSDSSGTRILEFQSNANPAFIVHGNARFDDVTIDNGTFSGTIQNDEIEIYNDRIEFFAGTSFVGTISGKTAGEGVVIGGIECDGPFTQPNLDGMSIDGDLDVGGDISGKGRTLVFNSDNTVTWTW